MSQPQPTRPQQKPAPVWRKRIQAGWQKAHSTLRMQRLRLSHALTQALLPSAPNTPAAAPWLKPLLSLYRPGLRLLPLQPLHSCPPLAVADRTPASPIWPPQATQATQPTRTADEPVQLYHFQQAIASAYSSHLIARHPKTGTPTLFLETVNGIGADQANYATGFVLNHNQHSALISLPDQHLVHCRHALLLGGNAAGNYYHWLIEILPQLPWLQALEAQLPADTLWVLPQACAEIPSYRDSLACIAPQLAQKAVLIGPKQQLHADNLYRLNSPNALVFNLRTPLLTPEFFRFHGPSLAAIRHRVLQHLDAQIQHAPPLPKRVFLARRQNLRRLYNQAEVEHCLQGFGITPIYPEDLSFAQQVQLFQQAEIIIGASGAAWSNLLFARAGLKALSWLPERYMGFAAFSSLAHYHGCQMVILPVQAHLPHFIHSSYQVDMDALQQQLERLL